MKSLRQIRLSKGIYLEHVATDTGVTIASLSLMERGNISPNEATRKRLEKYFDEKINWIATPNLITSPK